MHFLESSRTCFSAAKGRFQYGLVLVVAKRLNSSNSAHNNKSVKLITSSGCKILSTHHENDENDENSERMTMKLIYCACVGSQEDMKFQGTK